MFQLVVVFYTEIVLVHLCMRVGVSLALEMSLDALALGGAHGVPYVCSLWMLAD